MFHSDPKWCPRDVKVIEVFCQFGGFFSKHEISLKRDDVGAPTLSNNLQKAMYMAHGTIGKNRNAWLQGTSPDFIWGCCSFCQASSGRYWNSKPFCLTRCTWTRHRICNGTLALGCGYCEGFYSSCSHGRHGRRQGYCTLPFEQNSAKLSKCVINSYGMALTSAIIAVQVVTITPFRWVLWKDE